MKIHENFSLKRYNSLKIDVKAKYFVRVNTRRQLEQLIQQNYFNDNKFVILGSGTNILFTKDFDGIVVKNNIASEFVYGKSSCLNKELFTIHLDAHSGMKFDEMLQEFLNFLTEDNLFVFGLENLAKIPGTVGAAIVQNIGAYGVEQKDFLSSFYVIDLRTGKCGPIHTTPSGFDDDNNCIFGYRTSVFKQKDNPLFILYVRYSFKVSEHNTPILTHPDLKKRLKNVNRKEITPQLIYDTVSEIRASKLPDVKQYPNAGSFFKNPIITKEQLKTLKQKFPDIVFYDYGDEIKVSAAWLIEYCGLKGVRVGDVGTHKKHSLILVNYGNATGQEVVDFANHIITVVKSKFNIVLEPEVVYI